MLVAGTLLEHEWMVLAERATVEGILLLLVRIGVVTTVKTSSQFGVAENLVRLVDFGHLLLGGRLGQA